MSQTYFCVAISVYFRTDIKKVPAMSGRTMKNLIFPSRRVRQREKEIPLNEGTLGKIEDTKTAGF